MRGVDTGPQRRLWAQEGIHRAPHDTVLLVITARRLDVAVDPDEHRADTAWLGRQLDLLGVSLPAAHVDAHGIRHYVITW